MLKTIPFHQELVGQGSLMEILLYGLIEVLSYEKGFCYASNKYLAEQLGITVGTLANNLSNIAKKGWVQVQLDEVNQREAIIPQLWGGSLENEGGVHSKMNIYKKKDNIVNNNIINKDKSLLIIGETPETYGNDEINEAFKLWEQAFGIPQKNNASNRRAAYNLLRSKDKGLEWIKNSLKILSVAKRTRYTRKEVAGISNYADLQQNWEYLWQWGRNYAESKAKQTITDKI